MPKYTSQIVGWTHWKLGKGGWHDDYIYIPAVGMKYKDEIMIEIDLGLKGKIEPHLK